MAECSDRVEVSRGTHSYVDHGIGIECVGSADREHSSASEAEIEQRACHALVVDVVDRETFRTVGNEYRSQLGEQLRHHPARIGYPWVQGDTVRRYEADSIRRPATHGTHGASAPTCNET